MTMVLRFGSERSCDGSILLDASRVSVASFGADWTEEFDADAMAVVCEGLRDKGFGARGLISLALREAGVARCGAGEGFVARRCASLDFGATFVALAVEDCVAAVGAGLISGRV